MNKHKDQSKIMIVDDTAANLKLLDNMLRTEGYTIFSFPRGDMALKGIDKNPPDLILLDINMPGMNGFDVCEHLKTDDRFREIPVIFISALNETIDIVKAFSIGGIDYITKPFQFEEVLVRVQTHLSIRSMQKKLSNANKHLKTAQHELEKLNSELEDRVYQRTMELEKLNEALRGSNDLNRSITQTAPMAIISINSDGIISSWNNTAEKIFGYSASEIMNKSLLKIMPKQYRDNHTLALRRLKDGGKTKLLDKTIEITALRKDNTEFPVELSLSSWTLNQETYYTGIIIDISERVKALKEQRLLMSAIEQSADSIVITDTEATIQYVNPAFEKITGYSKEKAIGQNSRVLKSGRHDEVFYKEMWDTLTSGQTWQGNICNKAEDGRLFTERAIISPVFDSSGTLINYIGVKHDVTKQLDLEQQLAQAQKMETVGRLAGGVAHDFNNMLAVILGTVELNIESIDPKDPLVEELQTIQEAAQRSADITRQLLAFSRKQVIEPKIINLNPLITEMEKMLGRLIDKDIDLLFLPAEDLWTIKADPGQINQIVANLGINARDAMPDGGKLTIETANVTIDDSYCQGHVECTPGQFVMLTVSDNGIGMNKETQAQIFEPFFTTKEEFKGTGLGLSTVYGIVKQHNGFINVYSELGYGTSFKLYFPQYTEQQKKNTIIVETQKYNGDGTILLVEDDEMVFKLTKKILERRGYSVLPAQTPGEALKICEKSDVEIHLLLTDVVMPQMNGRKLKESIETIRPEIRTIFMSGHTAGTISHHGVLDKGMNFIQKPFSTNELVKKIQKVMDQ